MSECPWSTMPQSLDATAEALMQKAQWELDNPDQAVPANWGVMATDGFVLDVAQRMLRVEAMLRDVAQYLPAALQQRWADGA